MNTSTTQSPVSLGSPLCSAVFAFEVWPKGKEEWARTINARTRGKAKSEYHRDVSESWEIDYRLIRCRKIGKPVTSERFRHNARYRGMPDVECGQRVKVGDAFGVIVGHNASANFNVLFDDDAPRYAGMTLNCHPQSVEILQQNETYQAMEEIAAKALNAEPMQRLVRVWLDCPKCGAKPPTAHDLGGGPHFDGIRTCGNGCGTWETIEEWQAIRDASDQPAGSGADAL